VRRRCPKTCGLCSNDEPTNHGGAEASLGECADLWNIKKCNIIKCLNKCTKKKAKKKCPKTCGLCEESESGTPGSTEECNDCMSIKKCTKILNKNKCDGKKAKIKCQKTCGVCTATDNVLPKPKPIGEGENCESLNENTENPFSNCEPGLVCKDTARLQRDCSFAKILQRYCNKISLSGAGKTCVRAESNAQKLPDEDGFGGTEEEGNAGSYTYQAPTSQKKFGEK